MSHSPDLRRRWASSGPALLLTVTVLLALAVTWTVSDVALRGALAFARGLEAGNDVAGRALVSVVVVSGASLLAVAIWARRTSPRRPLRLAEGRGTIALDEVEARLRAALLTRADVVEAEVRIENLHRRGVSASATLAVTADARLTEAAVGAASAIEGLLERAGVTLAEPPRLRLRYRELQLRSRGAHV